MTKTLYCVSVKRGRRTSYSYSEKLKDAVAALKLKPGEEFTYVCYRHEGKVRGLWKGKTWVTV